MVDGILLKKYGKDLSCGKNISLKAVLSLCLIAMAVIFPQVIHLIFGQQGGGVLLPMYLPVLLGGLLLGVPFGAFVGVTAPLVSFVLTGFAGEPMPSIKMLPIIMAELAVFAVVSGCFGRKAFSNSWWSVAGVISAQISGRLTFFCLNALFITSADASFMQIQKGFAGLAVQLVTVPLLIFAIKKFTLKK